VEEMTDSEDILKAVALVGEAVREKLNKKNREDQEKKNAREAVEVGYPVGTKLFIFSIEEGIEDVEVTGEKRIRTWSDGWCRENEREMLAETKEDAVRKSVMLCVKNDWLDPETDIKNLQRIIEYHHEEARWYSLCIDIIKEVSPQ
jgi:hypothetical protein